MKRATVIILVLIVIGAGFYFGYQYAVQPQPKVELVNQEQEMNTPSVTEDFSQLTTYKDLHDRAEALYAAKDYSRAIQGYQEIYNRYSNEWQYGEPALSMIGTCYKKLRQMDKSIEAYEKAVREYPDKKGWSESTYLYLGEAYRMTGQKDKALTVYKKCVELCEGSRDPNTFPYKDALKEVAKLEGRS